MFNKKRKKMIMEMFEKASKQKLRYKVTSGTISTEDLWDLDLDSLDLLAKTLNKAIKDSEEESFIKSKSTANTTLELKFEIVKHVIEVKLQLEDERKSAKEKAAKRVQLANLINQKENEELSSKSLDELKKLIEEV